MMLTKDEYLSALRGEFRLLSHLASKATEEDLAYRPSPGQRTLIDLLRYLSIMPGIHVRLAVSGSFDMASFGAEWAKEQAAAQLLDLPAIQAQFASLPILIAELLAPVTDDDLRTPIQLFGHNASRGHFLVTLVLSHLSAYRMQLFLYLKSSSHPELNTMNLWAGIDQPL